MIVGAELCFEGLLEDAGDVLVEEEDRKGDHKAKMDLDVVAVEEVD